MTDALNDKQRVAIHCADMIESGMVVGLGTGSTANYFIDELARRQQSHDLKIKVVSSSVVSQVRAQQQGLDMISPELIAELDVYVDGADEVTLDLSLLKGRGQDLVKEKILATAAGQFVVLVDNSKLVEHIGQNNPIPIEVVPFAWQMVLQQMTSLGAEGGLRNNASGDGLALSSHGSLILDMQFPQQDWHELARLLDSMPGIVEHGIFVNLATAVMIGQDGQIETRYRQAD